MFLVVLVLVNIVVDKDRKARGVGRLLMARVVDNGAAVEVKNEANALWLVLINMVILLVLQLFLGFLLDRLSIQ